MYAGQFSISQSLTEWDPISLQMSRYAFIWLSHTYVHTYKHTCIHSYIYIHADPHADLHACMHAYKHIHTYIHAHIHAYIQIHTYVFHPKARREENADAVGMRPIEAHMIMYIQHPSCGGRGEVGVGQDVGENVDHPWVHLRRFVSH